MERWSRENQKSRHWRGNAGRNWLFTISVGEVFMEVDYDYPDPNVHLTLFNAAIIEGTPQMIEHNDIQWITVTEIPQYEFCPADEEILRKLRTKA